MRAYIIRSNVKIEPFGELACDCLVLNRTIAENQMAVFSKFDIEPIVVSSGTQITDSNEHILLDDNLFFTPELLGKFIEESRRRRSMTVCALKSGVTTTRTAVSVQNVRTCLEYTEYNLRYFPEMNQRENCQTIVLNPDKLSASLTIPKHMCNSGRYSIPMSELLVAQIDHWVNLWVMNIVAILSEGARIQRSSKAKLLFLALKAKSFNKWKILSHLNEIGQNCDIHPTAYIEGSIIGDDVVVGAGAVVKESVVGNSVCIGNGVVIEESVIGRESTILNGHILYSVLYPGTFSVTEMISASLLGKDTFVGLGVVLTDFRLDGKNVTILKNGVAIDSGNKFLGACLGHGVYLGSGCIVAPGRTVPNGLHITPSKEKIFTSFDGQLSRDFRLVGE